MGLFWKKTALTENCWADHGDKIRAFGRKPQDQEEAVVQKRRILIVEDDRPVAQALWRALNTPQGGGYMVENCESAEVALERLRNAHFDLLIADLRLPGINGLELIEQVHQSSPGTYSVLITAFGSPQVATHARRVADAYVLKPFRLRDMIQLVERIFNADQKRANLEQTDLG
jgi:two-component system response regulator YesN